MTLIKYNVFMNHYLPRVFEYVSAIQLISLSPVPMSGAGTSMPGPVSEQRKQLTTATSQEVK